MGEPVAHCVTAITLLKVHQDTVWGWLSGDGINRLGAQGSLDCFNNLGRQITKVDIEIYPLAMLAWLSRAPSEHGHVRFHQHTVGNHNHVPVARFNRRVPPSHFFHYALFSVNFDSFAYSERALQLQRHPA